MKRTKLLLILTLVVVLVAACAGNQATPTATPMPEPTEEAAETMGGMDDLTANQWQWVAFTDPTQQFDVENPMSYLLTFNEDGTLIIKADCNMANGSFTAEDGSLTIEVGAATLALCPGDSRGEQFVELLGGAARYFFEDGNLYIDLMADGGTMEFAPAEGAVLYEEGSDTDVSLTSNQWEWVSFTNPTDMFDVDVPMHYLLTFNDDGTLNIKADCNLAMGSYTEDDGSLSLEVGPMTRALCPEDSRSEQFVGYLGGAARYFFENGFLYIDLMADGGTMMFGPAEEAVLYEIGPDAMEGVLTSNQWQWVSFTSPVEQIEVDEPMRYLIDFSEDGSLAIKADCNNAAGDYTEDAGSLTIEVGPAQLALCPGDSRGEQFLSLLGGAARYFFDSGFLFLDLMADGGTMAFAPAEQAVPYGQGGALSDAVIGIPWQWVSVTTPAERIDIDSPENYLLTFNPDGTVLVEADCNNAGGSYFFEGSSLTIELGAVTAVECGEASRSDQFLTLLSSSAIAFLEGGNLYIDTLADAGTMEFMSVGMGDAGLDAFDPDATPIFGILAGGGNDGVWLDPTVVSINGGVVGSGPSIDISGLGIGCGGRITPQPDVHFYWLQDDDVDTLRIFFLSGGDPTMVVSTPNGEILCNDDLNPLVLDPYIEIPQPAEGRYAVWVGSFENDVTEPGFLVLTGHDWNPATFDIASLVQREVDPAALGEPLALDVLTMTGTPVEITPDDTPFEQELVGGGELGAFNIELDNPLCTGFIDAAPTFTFSWTGEAEKLVMFFEGDTDSTLVVHTPIDTFACDDDAAGADNLNPWLDLTPIPGLYYVWVGSFSPDTPVNGTLTIAGDPALRPEPLTSDMMNQ